MPKTQKTTEAKITTKKTAVKKEALVAKPTTPKPAVKKTTTVELAIPAVNLKGEQVESVVLPKEVFGVVVNNKLLAQAVRIYQNNQKGHFSNTKTRGQVEGSTAKMGPQKGSGRARHGSKRAPIFVGGGIALGPKSRKTIMVLPQKMKKAALASALSAKVASNEAMVVIGLENVAGKTQEIANLMKKIAKKSVLFVTDEHNPKINQAVRNITKTQVSSASQVNAFDVLKYQTVLLTDKAIVSLKGVKNAD